MTTTSSFKNRRQVLSHEAELAQSLARTALGELRIQLRCERLTGPVGVPRLATRDIPHHRTRLLHSALVQVVAIGEEFSRSALSRAVEARLPLGSTLVTVLWNRAEREMSMTWQKQLQAWHDWLKVDMKKCGPYKQFEPYTDARNSISHGLGQLTPVQLGSDGGRAVKARLRRADIALAGNVLLIDEQVVGRCVGASACLTGWIDAQVRQL